ncbi:MAG: sigma-70 family RNA polymerase sigma factor [Clostridiales bacterium]|nr:sigma-70 family RNA polymerase sigma factor [Clostridiales bacterium]
MDTFESIYREYFSRVYGFIYRMCRDDDLAEELTQETFFQAFKSFRRFRGDSELFTWLAAIAKFTFFNYMRKNKCAECVNLDLIADTLSDSDDSDPEATVEKRETTVAIRRAISNMPEKYRDVVMLRLYAELPFSEIAESLKITENSAKVIFHRAKKMLTEELRAEV